jgi:pimeloyl-ACP methyl ester carboxylesterase
MRKWQIARSALVAAVAVLAAMLVSSSGSRPSHARADGPRPTIVLVHGAWADGSSWAPVAQRLQHDGYTVDVAPNPLRGLASDAAYVSAIQDAIQGPIVLVGHSYGGAVITNAALGNPDVKALVYFDAFIPKKGQSVIRLANAVPGSELAGDPSAVFNAVPYPGAPPGDVDLYVKPTLFASAFGNDLPADQAALLAASQRPLTLSAGLEPSGEPAWKTIPSWAVVGTLDRVIPPREQRIMAHHAGAQITAIAAGHLSMLSQPDAVTAVIEQAAAAVG